VCDISGPPGARNADEKDAAHERSSGHQTDAPSHESANRAPPIGDLQHDPAAEEVLV